ncbi:peroxidase mlt-7-like isoform X2 [Macrobrachium rosenbergii]
MTMLNSLSILLGSVQYPNNSLQIQHNSMMTSSSDGGCCGCHQNSCCHDLCAFDPPEVLSDPLEGIPTDDESLSILVGLRWPRRDFSWFMEVFVKFIMPKLRQKRQISGTGILIGDLASASDSTTIPTPKTATQSTTSTPGATTRGTNPTSGTTTQGTTSTPGTTTQRTTSTPGTTTQRTTSTPRTTTQGTTPTSGTTTQGTTSTLGTTTQGTTSTPGTTTQRTTSTPRTTTQGTTPTSGTSTQGTTSTPGTTTRGTTPTSGTSTQDTTSTPGTTTQGTTSTPGTTTQRTTSTPRTTTQGTTPTSGTSTQGTTSTPGTTTRGTTPTSGTSTQGTTPTSGTTTRSTTSTRGTATEVTTTQSTTTSPKPTTNETTQPDDPIIGSVNVTNITDEDISMAEKFAEEMSLVRVFVLIHQDTTTQEKEGLVVGEGQLKEKDKIELGMEAANITFSVDDPSLKHQTAFRRTDPISTKMARGGLIQMEATSFFQKSFKIPDEAVSGLLILGTIAECSDVLSDFRRPQFSVCFPSNPYRTLDGSCNNLANILWGAAFRPYRRDLRAEYDDGVSTFRRSVENVDLPSARLVSTTINRIRSEGSRSLSILHMSFGQFLDHDFVATPLAQVTSIYGGGPVKCCDNFFFVHPDCAPISIPSDDEFYKRFGETCMEFVRSAPIQPFCRFFPREQSSQQSAYLDGSVIYGVQPFQTMELRNFTCGLLKGQVTEDGQTLLPRELNLNDGCNTGSMVGEGKFCFKAGDGRANEQVLLTFFQTLFAREHNRIAKILCKCHADWDDEMIFQETRKIIWALLQQVTYNEFLPTVIGPTLMTSSKLFPLKGDQQTDDYDPYINAAIANNFATAAYRFGHSLIADNLLYVTRHGSTSPKALSTQFFNPFELYRRDAVCDIARGGLNLPEDNMDPYFTLEVAGKLFRGPHPFGLDLLALNIQRGRDHGLPPYNRWRVFCGLPSASSFSDLSKDMTQDRIDALQRVYLSVEDIDLYAGGVSENPIPGGILGHTFTCLIHNQFFRLKYGDRYWFEYKNSPGAFSPAQMEQLHNATLAMIMCNNLPELEYVQRWPLKNPGADNPKVCCKSIRRYSLKPWTPGCPDDEGQDKDCHQKGKREKGH